MRIGNFYLKLKNWRILVGIALFLLAIALQLQSESGLTPRRAFAQTNPIVLENQNPGSNNWKIDYNIGTIANDVSQQIKGYASAVSIDQGQSINFHITVNPAQPYTIDVYRMGYYGGAGGRLMQTIAPLNGTPQPACPLNTTLGLLECSWAVAHTLAVPSTWTTGVYLAKLTNSLGFQSYIIFTVRDDDRVADFLYQQPVTTYQAYNNYPDNGATGKSFYTHNSYGANTVFGTTRAVKISFDRPYSGAGGFDGGGHFADEQWWEHYFVSWAERMGYDISYSTDVDTHVNGARLLNFKGFLSLPHDEYWSKEMYDAVMAARDGGVNLAFFGANTSYWQTRFEPSSTGVANRVLVSYRNAALDPNPNPATKTILFRDSNQAEQRLVGIQYVTDGSFYNMLPYTVQNSNHWLWNNTGFSNGTIIPGLLGYEVDRLMPEYPAPTTISYTVAANSVYTSTSYNPTVVTNTQSSIYQAPSGAWVFASGTMAWVWGLDRPGYINAGIQQAAKNLLDRFLLPVVTPTPTNTGGPTPTITNTPTPVATNTPTPTATPPANCGGLTQQAEAGVLSGTFVVANDPAASGGQYVHAPNGSGDQWTGPNQARKVTFCFTVTTAGLYRIKSGVYGADTLSDSFYVQVDGAPTAGYVWDTFPNTTYANDYVSNRSVVDPVEVQLSTGQHIVAVFVREDGTRLDTIQLEPVNPGPGPNPVCAGLIQEGESGARSGKFVVGNDAGASGGQYVHTPNGSGDQWNGPNATQKVAYCFNLTTAGIYRIKTKVYASGTLDDSFYTQVDGAPVTGHLWDVTVSTTYTVDYVSDRSIADPVQIQLPVGPHTVTVYLREAGARIDTIQLELVSSGPGPNPVCAGLLQQAESGALSGAFMLGSDVAASGGQYITTLETAGDQWNGPNAQHKAAFCFNVATTGTYRIRGGVYGTDDLSDSYYVQVDNAPAAGFLWDTQPNSSYLIDFVSNRNVADPVQVVLSSGPHTVTVYLREDAARLDTLELVQVGQMLVQAQAISGPIEYGFPEIEPLDLGKVAQGVHGFIRPNSSGMSSGTSTGMSNEVDFNAITLTLIDSATKGQLFRQQVHADRIGYYRFDGMSAGDYILTLSLPAEYATSTNEVALTASAEQLTEVSIDITAQPEQNEEGKKIFLPLVNR